MKTCIIPLFLFLAVNTAWATFPLPYIQLGILPHPHQFVPHYPQQRFGAQSPFLVYPQFRRDFLDVYQPLTYAQPERYDYFQYPQAPKYPAYPAYPAYNPVPENAHNSVVEYVYQQTPLHPISSSLGEPTTHGEPVVQILNKIAEESVPDKMTQHAEEITEASKPKEVTTNPTKSTDNSESEGMMISPTNANDNSNIDNMTTNSTNIDDNSTSEEVTIKPINSVPEPESMEPTERNDAENLTTQSTEDHESDATPSMEETPSESRTTA